MSQSDHLTEAELRRRLAEAEAALAALRSGKADTLMGDAGPLLFQLKSAVEEQKQAEAALRENEARNVELARFNQDVLDALSAHICVLAEDGTILAVNKAWRSFAATNPPAPANADVGANYLAVCEAARGEDAATAREAVRGLRAVARGEVPEFRLEYPCHSPDTQRWFLLRATRSTGPDGTFLVVAHEDITERMRAEAALRESEARLTFLMQATPVVIYTCKPSGDYGATFVTENVLHQTGYSPREFTEDSGFWASHIHPDDRARVLAELPRLFEQGHHVHEYRFRHKDGRDLWMHDQCRLVRDADGSPREIIGCWLDVTARKRMEAELRRAQRLESIGSLTSGIAHDLNNALAPVLMGIGILQARYPNETQMIDLIRASTERAADMVKHLVTFARGTEGERVVLHPQDLFKEMERIIRNSFPKNIALTRRYAPGLRTVCGDATQLHQVLLNLCVNARDAMPHGGTLTLVAENADLDDAFASAVPEARPGPYVVCRVQDTGTGIPPEIQERIFEPFFTTKPREKGTGLGLSTVTGIVRIHGGFIRLDSAPGRGAMFAVYLPASETGTAADAAATAAAAPPLDGRGRIILVVDDEEPVRRVMRTVLEQSHFKVLTAPNATGALVEAAEHRADLAAVITDLHMPSGMDGVALAQVLRQMLPQAGILVATGQRDEKESRALAELGLGAVLDKPFTKNTLLAALQSVLDRN